MKKGNRESAWPWSQEHGPDLDYRPSKWFIVAFGPVHSNKSSAGIRQRRCRMTLRIQGMVAIISAPALGTALEYARLTFLDAAASGPAVLLVRPVRSRGGVASRRGKRS